MSAKRLPCRKDEFKLGDAFANPMGGSGLVDTQSCADRVFGTAVDVERRWGKCRVGLIDRDVRVLGEGDSRREFPTFTEFKPTLRRQIHTTTNVPRNTKPPTTPPMIAPRFKRNRGGPTVEAAVVTFTAA